MSSSGDFMTELQKWRDLEARAEATWQKDGQIIGQPTAEFEQEMSDLYAAREAARLEYWHARGLPEGSVK